MSMPSAVAIVDDSFRFLTANASFVKLTGLAAREIEGRRVSSVFAFSDVESLIATRRSTSVEEGPNETPTRILRVDGTDRPVMMAVTAVHQPGFNRLTILSLSEVAPSAATELARRVVIAGKIQLVGLEEVKAALGDRWQSHAERILSIAARIIKNRLNPKDICSPTADCGFVICFAEGTEEEAAFKAAAIAREVRDRLIGESDDPSRAAVTAITRALECGESDSLDPSQLQRELERRLNALRGESEARAREDLATAFREAALDQEPLFNRSGNVVPLVHAKFPMALRNRIDLALGVLPPAKVPEYDFDILLLTLAGEAVAENRRKGVSRIHLVRVDYSIFGSRRRIDSFVSACKAIPAPFRSSLVLVLAEVPSNVPQSRLQEIVRLLQPFFKLIGVEPASLEAVPADLVQSRIGIVAFSADRLATWTRSRRAKVESVCRRIRISNAKMVSIGATSLADAEFAWEAGADFVSYVDDPAKLPKSELLATHQDAAFSMEFAHRAIFEATENGVVYADATRPDHPAVLVNPAFVKMTGYAEDEVIGRNCRFLQGRDTDPSTVAEIRQALERGESIRREILNYKKDGTPFWNQLFIAPVFGSDGRLLAFASIQTDVSAVRKAEATQRKFAELLESIADNVPGFIYQCVLRKDGSFDFIYLSRSANKVFGIPAGTKITHKMMVDFVLPGEQERVERELLLSAEYLKPLNYEYRIIRSDGEIRWIRSRANPVKNAEGDVVWNGAAIDITSEKSVEDKLFYIAQHDPLTGLSNTAKFRSDLSARFEDGARNGEGTALFMLDLARFHEINDAYGLAVGDQVLKTVPERLKSVFPPTALIYRLHGDHFAIIVGALTSDEEALALAERACRVVARPISIEIGEITLSAAVGLCIEAPQGEATYKSAADTARQFEERADIALHEAKRSGREKICLYRGEIDDRVRNSALVKQSLGAAIEREQFELYYQPLVDLVSGKIVGAEALIRWNHPTLGLQRPDQFIPMAEETGLIIPLGEWVLREALRGIRDFASLGLIKPRIAVNISGLQLLHGQLLETVGRLLAEFDVEPSQIELELTENYFIECSKEIHDKLLKIRDFGIKIAIDDFGAGYSSFRYLKDLPIDKLKIDQIFVRGLEENSNDIPILKAMMSLGSSLGLEVVVEGVETAFQRNLLRDIGCSIGQGYFFSLPLAREDFIWLLQQDAPLPLKPAP
jgi:diguanylate cyclase (GGDEF)-like protein/PAS domain S-box-containing protein